MRHAGLTLRSNVRGVTLAARLPTRKLRLLLGEKRLSGPPGGLLNALLRRNPVQKIIDGLP